jgi:hypothetical protein
MMLSAVCHHLDILLRRITFEKLFITAESGMEIPCRLKLPFIFS